MLGLPLSPAALASVAAKTYRGPNLVADARFQGLGGWNPGTGWSASNGGVHSGAVDGFMNQDCLVQGKKYEITINVTAHDSGYLIVYCGQSATYLWANPGDALGTKKVELVCAGDSILYLRSNGVCTVANISVREI